MSSRRGGFVEGKVYVGGLPEDATSEELDDAFHKFGRIRKIWVARRPPGFAFVEFDDHRDAEDAVHALDGTRICGVKARVELSTNGGGRGGGVRGFRGGGGGGGYHDRSRDYRDRSRNVPSIYFPSCSSPFDPSHSSSKKLQIRLRICQRRIMSKNTKIAFLFIFLFAINYSNVFVPSLAPLPHLTVNLFKIIKNSIKSYSKCRSRTPKQRRGCGRSYSRSRSR